MGHENQALRRPDSRTQIRALEHFCGLWKAISDGWERTGGAIGAAAIAHMGVLPKRARFDPLSSRADGADGVTEWPWMLVCGAPLPPLRQSRAFAGAGRDGVPHSPDLDKEKRGCN